MNKKVFGKKLSRSRPSREALFASLTRSMIINGKVTTTHAKAKAVQGMIEKMMTLAKKGDINARRIVLSNLDNAKDAVDSLFKNVAKAFEAKKSGFTRIILLPSRKGDNSKMARIEWTEKVEAPKVEKIEKVSKTKKAEVKIEEKKAKK